MTMFEQMYGNLRSELKKSGIEDTLQNRITALKAIRETWTLEESPSLEVSMYRMAVSRELTNLTLRQLAELMKERA